MEKLSMKGSTEMDEKLVVEMVAALKDIRDKLAQTSIGNIRGPVADPGPDWFGHFPGGIGPVFPNFRGPIGDPGPWQLLDKSRIARLKVRQIDIAVGELKQQMELLQLQQQLLKEEYKL